jgi:hypothetical protein
LLNSHVLSSIFLTLKSQITPIFVRPVGVNTSEAETSTPPATGKHHLVTADPQVHDKVIQTWVELASAKPVLPQRFRPPAPDDKKDDKKPDTPAK